MPVAYAFFDAPALICIRYEGHINADELIEAGTQFGREMTEYVNYPHFFDFSKVTGYTIDHTKLMSFMALLADIYTAGRAEQLFVFYAPPGPSAELAQMARRPWEGNSKIIIRVAETRSHACDILGCSQKDLREHLDDFTT